MMSELDKYGKSLLKYPNVKGYAKTLQNRQKRGKEVSPPEMCLQVLVTRKVSEKVLRPYEILPRSIAGIPVDVKVIGYLWDPLEPIPKAQVAAPAKTDRISPLVAGISIGNADITAGTLGNFVEKTTTPDKNTPKAATNAHVGTSDPSKEGSVEKRILQPGAHDGGTFVALTYYWHKQLYPEQGPSGCIPSNWLVDGLNLLSKSLHRKTRFRAVVEEVNHIDYCVADILDKWENKFFDVEYDPDKFNFAGYGFGGSDQAGFTCKGFPYQKDEGYSPIGYDFAEEIFAGDILQKTGRSSCYNTTVVRVPSVFIRVNYGAYIVPLDDVVMHDPNLIPGDSGSGMMKEIR